jgi:hypothetical protein
MVLPWHGGMADRARGARLVKRQASRLRLLPPEVLHRRYRLAATEHRHFLHAQFQIRLPSLAVRQRLSGSPSRPPGIPRASRSRRLGRLVVLLALCGLPGLLVACAASRGRFRLHRLVRSVAYIFLFLISTTWLACGDGGGPRSTGGGTPAGTYNLSVSGSFSSGSTTLSRSARLTLVVQ